jgi:hypothetical protein
LVHYTDILWCTVNKTLNMCILCIFWTNMIKTLEMFTFTLTLHWKKFRLTLSFKGFIFANYEIKLSIIQFNVPLLSAISSVLHVKPDHIRTFQHNIKQFLLEIASRCVIELKDNNKFICLTIKYCCVLLKEIYLLSSFNSSKYPHFRHVLLIYTAKTSTEFVLTSIPVMAQNYTCLNPTL